MSREEIDLNVRCLDDIARVMTGDAHLGYVSALSYEGVFGVYEENLLSHRLGLVVNRRLRLLLLEVYADLFEHTYGRPLPREDWDKLLLESVSDKSG